MKPQLTIEILDKIALEANKIINSKYGENWTIKQLDQVYRKVCKKYGFTYKTFNDFVNLTYC